MEVFRDLPSHKQYPFDGLESCWDPSLLSQQESDAEAISPSMAGMLSPTESSDDGLLDILRLKKPISVSKSHPLSCQPYIKKTSKAQNLFVSHAVKKEIGRGVDENLVYLNGLPLLLDHPNEVNLTQVYLNSGSNVSMNDMLADSKRVFEGNFYLQSCADGQLHRVHGESTPEKDELSRTHTKSPVNSASISLGSSDSSTSNETLGSSNIPFMNTFLNQTAMTGYPANELTTLFENPLTSMAEAMESRNSDGCLSNDSNPISDDSGMNSRDVDAFPHVCENWKEARAQIFFGNYDCYQGVRSMPFASNEEIRNPRIDFEGDYMQPHSLVQEDKSLIRGGLPSSDYTQFCFPRPVLRPHPYYDYSTYKPQVINDMSSCRPAFCTLPWGNEVPDRYTDNKHQSDMSGSRDTISASSYASSGIVVPQASASVKSENGMDVCHMVNWISNAGRIGRESDMVPKDGNLDARCVQLFTECAEELVRKNSNLASATLARLRDMVCHPIHTMQRVITYFMEGLQLQIEGVKGDAQARAHGRKPASQGDFIAAFQILHEIFPYIKFGHFTANQAILEAVEGADKVHIVDFEILEGIQWPAFMQALVLRKGGPPEVRITALCWPTQEHAMDMTQKTCKRLAEFASTMNLPFSYNLLMVNNDENIDPSQIKVNQGEALVVNCMVHLPHMPQHTMAAVRSFVHAVKKLSPLVITLVEEELGCSAIAAASFFSEALHHFHAICDSLEACLPSGLDARILVERVFVAPRITSAIDMWIRRISPCPVYVAGAGDKYKWSTILHSAGLKPLPFSFHNQSQAKLLLGLHKDGFKLVERSHHLALAWQTRPLYAASVWK